MRGIETVTVVGVGLIGGSFALALRRIGFDGRILGVSSAGTLSKAQERGVIDAGATLEEALPGSDLVYMAQPVPRILEQLEPVRRLVPDHALVTDAGSTKRAIVERARALFDGGPEFVGGHPMAGKEGRGVQLADASLFEGAAYALVPTGETLPQSGPVETFRSWLEAMGCRLTVMEAAEHDDVVAWTSHMPQLVSTALAAAIGDRLPGAGQLGVAGDGLRDMTRLAASAHDVWEGILRTNRGPIDEALRAVLQEIEALRGALGEDAAKAHFRRGQALRDRMVDE